MALTICEPTTEDDEALIALTHQLSYELNKAQMLSNLHFHMNDDAHFIFVAKEKKKIVGYVSLAIFHWFHKSAKIARLTALVVSEDARKKGVGKALVEYAENLARDKGCEKLELTSSIAREAHGTHAFYRSLGYVDVRQSSVCFRKELIE